MNKIYRWFTTILITVMMVFSVVPSVVPIPVFETPVVYAAEDTKLSLGAAGFLDKALQNLEKSASTAMKNLKPVALWMWAIFGIIEIVTIWSLYEGRFRMSEMISLILKLSFYLFLILNWSKITMSIIDFFERMGALAGGTVFSKEAIKIGSDTATVQRIVNSPSLVIDAGWAAVERLWDRISVTSPVEGLFTLVAILLTVVGFFLMSFEIFVTRLELMFFIALSILFLPLNVCKFTQSFGQNLFGGLVGYGAKLMVIIFLIGIIFGNIEMLDAEKLAASSTSMPQDLANDFKFGFIVLALGMMVMKAGSIAQSLVSGGGPSSGHRDLMAVGAYGLGKVTGAKNTLLRGAGKFSAAKDNYLNQSSNNGGGNSGGGTTGLPSGMGANNLGPGGKTNQNAPKGLDSAASVASTMGKRTVQGAEKGAQALSGLGAVGSAVGMVVGAAAGAVVGATEGLGKEAAKKSAKTAKDATKKAAEKAKDGVKEATTGGEGSTVSPIKGDSKGAGGKGKDGKDSAQDASNVQKAAGASGEAGATPDASVDGSAPDTSGDAGAAGNVASAANAGGSDDQTISSADGSGAGTGAAGGLAAGVVAGSGKSMLEKSQDLGKMGDLSEAAAIASGTAMASSAGAGADTSTVAPQVNPTVGTPSEQQKLESAERDLEDAEKEAEQAKNAANQQPQQGTTVEQPQRTKRDDLNEANAFFSNGVNALKASGYAVMGKVLLGGSSFARNLGGDIADTAKKNIDNNERIAQYRKAGSDAANSVAKGLGKAASGISSAYEGSTLQHNVDSIMNSKGMNAVRVGANHLGEKAEKGVETIGSVANAAARRSNQFMNSTAGQTVKQTAKHMGTYGKTAAGILATLVATEAKNAILSPYYNAKNDAVRANKRYNQVKNNTYDSSKVSEYYDDTAG